MLLDLLLTGLRFIPLRTPGGESASHIGLFVRIKMDNLSHKYASSGGICLQEDLPKRWSSLRLPETCSPNLDFGVEGIEPIKECKVEETTNNYTLPSSAANNQSKLSCQEAIIQCTAEIHSNPFAFDC